MAVDIGIGQTLREARNRRKMGLVEVEDATKIRRRYLRAIENEEWDVLPGGAYTRAFVRTYADHLGLDGERLVDEYRRRAGPPPGERPPRVEPATMAGAGRRGPRMSGRAWAGLISLALIGIAVGVGLAGGGGGSNSTTGASTHEKRVAAAPQTSPPAQPQVVALRLTAAAEVWVCLLDAGGQALVDGQILEAGAEEGPFHSKRFTIALGNGSVSLQVDGEDAPIPPSSSPVGYAVGPSGELTPLEEGRRPTCA
jgi:Helix-turn-helix domain/RodZ C-terminal domain